MTWTITRITDEGSVQLSNETAGSTPPSTHVRHHLHLAYATTVHGVQGDTAAHGDLVLSDATAVYVGLTRGRRSNTVHIVAGSVDEAREQSASTRPATPPAPRPGTTRPWRNGKPPQRPAPVRDGRVRVSFAERIGRVNARLAKTPTPAAAAGESTGAGVDEYQAEYETGHQQRQAGPRL
jgi:hypothetical protein